MKILLVDDDESLCEMTKEYLEIKGFEVQTANHVDKALHKLADFNPDLCVLDVKMPDINGFDFAQLIKKNQKPIPFIFLSGQSLKADKIQGLEIGAEDYITKPFSLEELCLRIKAVLRRTAPQPATQKVYQLGNYSFHPDYHELNYTKSTIKLTATESKLLCLLCEKSPEMVSREEVLLNIWGTDDYYKDRSLNVYITRLRNIFKTEHNIQIISVHGKGYKLLL